jgi:hypothetical protein
VIGLGAAALSGERYSVVAERRVPAAEDGKVSSPMAILELVQPRPDWLGALQIALTRPPGIPERRSGEDPWAPKTDRPRRISDDLAWFRDALDEPDDHGLRPLEDSAAVGAWETADRGLLARIARLEDRGVLQAAGFLLHDPDAALEI